MLMRLSTLGLDLVYTALLLLDANATLDSARCVASEAPVPEPNRKNLPLRRTRPRPIPQPFPVTKTSKFKGQNVNKLMRRRVRAVRPVNPSMTFCQADVRQTCEPA